MKTNVRFSKIQGRIDDKKLHSTSEFCRIVANDVITDVYGYFTSFYAAFIADTLGEKKRTEENNDDYVKRVMNKAYQKAKSTPTKELKETALYKTFSSKNQLFKLVRTISPCYYDEENRHRFAKVSVIGFNTAKLSNEKVNDMLDNGFYEIPLSIEKDANKFIPNGKKVSVITKQIKLDENNEFSVIKTSAFFCEKLAESRNQRKTKFAEMCETGVYFFDANDNLCTMVEHDQMNFTTLYAYVSEYAQRRNFQRVTLQQEKEKKTRKNAEMYKATQKLSANVSKTFNALLSFRNKVAKDNNNQYITDENKRNLAVAGFIKLTTEYKAACQKRFADWKESENEFLKDTAKVVRMLTIEPVQPKAASKKKGTKKAA